MINQLIEQTNEVSKDHEHIGVLYDNIGCTLEKSMINVKYILFHGM